MNQRCCSTSPAPSAWEAGRVYRRRHPQESPFYRLVERFYPEFEAVYEERYQERYGFPGSP